MNENQTIFQWIDALATDMASSIKVVAGVVILGLILVHAIRKQLSLGAIAMMAMVGALAYYVIILGGYTKIAQAFFNTL